MDTTDAATLVNLLGYISGVLLYAMLLLMITRSSRVASHKTELNQNPTLSADKLFFITSLLGLLWNFGSLLILTIRDVVGNSPPAWLLAITFTALGFLPAAVVHSIARCQQIAIARKGVLGLIIVAYSVSAIAALLHVYSTVAFQTAPSKRALLLLTLSFGVLILPLIMLTRRQRGWARAGWVIALAVFAVSALHLSHHDGEHYSWFIELIGHHASLPLVVAILYQDYRFALADIFLKRALTLIALVALASGLYVFVAAPLLSLRDGHISSNPLAVVTLLGLWIATALVYPYLRRAAFWFVDKLILRRADYDQLRMEISQTIALQDSPQAILDDVCDRLAQVLNADEGAWAQYKPIREAAQFMGFATNVFPLTHPARNGGGRQTSTEMIADIVKNCEANDEPIPLPASQDLSALILIPTTEFPHYALAIGQLSGGRQLLSDDLALLDFVAVTVARRIDALRITHERCEQDLREQQFGKLATEAELRALRAQINPHFLFNALTTIGYLIQTSSDRAFDTLMRLTELLRGVLRSAGEFVSLGEEIALIEAYLEIERARFEERLRVSVDVPASLRSIRIPALLIQPIVENAIKHGIAPKKTGGEVIIQAWFEDVRNPKTLCIKVRDTGVGASQIEMTLRRGVGINNVEQRLKNYFGQAATLTIHSAQNLGTVVDMQFPVRNSEAGETHLDMERKRA